MGNVLIKMESGDTNERSKMGDGQLQIERRFSPIANNNNNNDKLKLRYMQ